MKYDEKAFLIVNPRVTIGALVQLAIKIGMSGPTIQVTLASGVGAKIVWTIIRNLLVISDLIAYVVDAGLWLFVLSKADLSLVLPFTSLGFILKMLFDWLFLNESVGFDRIRGTLIIAFGAYLVARSSLIFIRREHFFSFCSCSRKTEISKTAEKNAHHA